ncbi:MAG TPA: hypothetical protein VI685_22480, partial [Candidatus Angelobacter sp.]
SLKVGLGCGTVDFFAVMVVVLLRPFFLLGLGLERLTFAATFFFILLCPYDQYMDSGKPRLWKLD